MAIPPITRNLVSGPSKQSNKREKNPVETVGIHVLSPKNKASVQVPSLLVKEFGHLGRIPAEVFEQVMDSFPVNSLSEIDQCIRQMKVFYRPDDYWLPSCKGSLLVFRSIDPEKLAKWIGRNKIHIADLYLNKKEFIKVLPHLEYLDMGLSHLGLKRNEPGIGDLPLSRALSLDDRTAGRLILFSHVTKDLESVESEMFKNVKHLKLEGQDYNLVTKFSELPSLELNGYFGGYPTLTDQDLKRIVEGLKNLKTLNLVNCTAITNQGFNALTAFANLNVTRTYTSC